MVRPDQRVERSNGTKAGITLHQLTLCYIMRAREQHSLFYYYYVLSYGVNVKCTPWAYVWNTLWQPQR